MIYGIVGWMIGLVIAKLLSAPDEIAAAFVVVIGIHGALYAYRRSGK